MTLRDALQRVYDKHGELTPELVVQVARNPKTKAERMLHERLEWDDAIAGEAHRRHQAQELIRSFRVTRRKATEDDEPLSIRAWHAVRTEKGYTYKPVEEVVRDEFLTKLLLADMRREYLDLKRRWEHFAEFAEMVRADLEVEAA